MAQRRFHYEQAFEHYLRANQIPYVAVDEAKKSLLPTTADGKRAMPIKLKSFDFVVYAADRNLLVDVKGRMFGSVNARTSLSNRRLESWVTVDDVDSMQRWQELFGSDFIATFVFAYCLRQQPPDALFEECFCHNGKWYALREVPLEQYRQEMVTRSEKWKTVHLPSDVFSRISRPFSARQGTTAGRASGTRLDSCE